MSELVDSVLHIAYATDVEGNYDYWQRYISLSKGLSRDASTGRLLLQPSFAFVYGGDVCDRGSGDLRLLYDLNNLYDDYPRRVHFILGNRDVNKMRIPVELHPSYLSSPGDVYWIPRKSDCNQSAAQRLQWTLANTMGSPLAFEYRRTELKILKAAGSYESIMSSAAKSSASLASLALEKKESAIDIDKDTGISDNDIVQSYIDQIDTVDSPMSKYLLRGVIAVHFGDVLFCHGGLNENNFGWLHPTYQGTVSSSASSSVIVASKTVTTSKTGGGSAGSGRSNRDHRNVSYSGISTNTAGSRDRDEDVTTKLVLRQGTSGGEICDNFKQWIQESNKRAKDEVIDFLSRKQSFLDSLNDKSTHQCHWASIGSYDHEQPGSRLGYLGMAVIAGPDKQTNPSIIYSSFIEGGMPIDIATSVTERMKIAGIKRLIVGHQPHGDCPTTLHQNGVQIYMGDTSYSRNTLWPKDQYDSKSDDDDDDDDDADDGSSSSKKIIGKPKMIRRVSAPAKVMNSQLEDLDSDSSSSKSHKLPSSTSTTTSSPRTTAKDDHEHAKDMQDKQKLVRQGSLDNEYWIKNTSDLVTINEGITPDNTRGITCSEIIVHLLPSALSSTVTATMDTTGTTLGTTTRIQLHGILSDSSTYDYESNDPHVDEYIGKYNASRTWFVKAKNVTVKNTHADSTSSSAWLGSGGSGKVSPRRRATTKTIAPTDMKKSTSIVGRNDMYLLSRGEGFNFKNKYVAPEDMDHEMSK